MMKVYHKDDINSEIRIAEDGKIVLKLYGTYASSTDITFILIDMNIIQNKTSFQN